MKKFSRLFLLGALAIILLTAACASEEGTPTVVGTLPPVDMTPSPLATDGTVTAETETTSTTPTLAATLETETPTADTSQITPTDTIPVTGDVILLECQFCVNNMAHAVLVLSDVATFEFVTPATSLSTPGPDTGCNTVDTFSGRQVVLCRAEENTTITLNVCTDGNCTELGVDLQSCPDIAGTPQPGVTATETPGAAVTDTPTPLASPTTGGATSTPTP